MIQRHVRSCSAKNAVNRSRLPNIVEVMSRLYARSKNSIWLSGTLKSQVVNRTWSNPGANEDRTPNLRIKNATLFHLSYSTDREIMHQKMIFDKKLRPPGSLMAAFCILGRSGIGKIWIGKYKIQIPCFSSFLSLLKSKGH
jgi:hypothetical protein